MSSLRPVRAVRPLAAIAGALVLVGTLGACSSASSDAAASASSRTPIDAPACPTDPVRVTVSVDQWGDIVSRLAGHCGDVTTVLASSSVDPHDFEPSPADAAAFSNAQLVVFNGDGYDTWASDQVKTLSPQPALVSAADVAHAEPGSNPHLWYSPTTVFQVADAVTAQLSTVDPDAADYFADRHADWKKSMQTYTQTIAALKAGAEGKNYGATETVFDPMAHAIGLTDATPRGYRNTSANDSDPAPGDLAAFQSELAAGDMDVLIFNAQTEGSIPDQIKSAAAASNVPVVSVTETLPDDAASFAQWQTSQLQALAKALHVAL